MNGNLRKIKHDTFVSTLQLLGVCLIMAFGFTTLSVLNAAVMTLFEAGFDYFQQGLKPTEAYTSRWRFIFTVWFAPTALYTLYFTVKNLYQNAIRYNYSKAMVLGEMEHPLSGSGVKMYRKETK